jgi:Family of unknown function (DUF6131)
MEVFAPSARQDRQATVGRGLTGRHACLEPELIILGIILLVIGFIAKIAILWTIGIIVLVIGLILLVLGMLGHAVGGRRHYY